MGNIGFYKRATRPVVVTYGSEMVDGSKLSAAYPVHGGTATTIYSGEPVYVKGANGSNTSYVPNTIEYFKVGDEGVTPTANTPVAWAFTDSNSFDVLGSGKLKGIPVEDKFEIATAFYDASKVYHVGDNLFVAKGYLHVDANGNSTVNTTAEGGQPVGIVTNDTPVSNGTYAVVGTVTRGEVLLDNNQPVAIASGVGVDINGGVVKTGGEGVVKGGQRQWTNDTGSKTVLVFETNWGKSVTVA